ILSVESSKKQPIFKKIMEKDGNSIWATKTKMELHLINIYTSSAEIVMRLAVVGIKATMQVALMGYE
ncbi:MAG: hypothetical protein PUG32_06885, partial [Bacteroidales bacterium]|nr:hypothetical protein [Bacteroidales bacterium]